MQAFSELSGERIAPQEVGSGDSRDRFAQGPAAGSGMDDPKGHRRDTGDRARCKQYSIFPAYCLYEKAKTA